MAMKTFARWISRMALWLIATAVPAQTLTYYADPARPGDAGDGRSWATAKRTLQAAIDATNTAHQVWARRGTYAESITLRSQTGVYGGFAGTESQLAERNQADNPTIINASHANAGQPATHAVVMDAISSATLDGLIVTGGGTSVGPMSQGGGVLMMNLNASSAVANCIIAGNHTTYYGGGIAIMADNHSPFAYGSTGNLKVTCDPKVMNCVISGNYDNGIYCMANAKKSSDPPLAYYVICTPQITNCIISGNRSSGGGALTCYADYGYWAGLSVGVPECSPIVRNCTLSDNDTVDGAILCWGRDQYGTSMQGICAPTLQNLVITGNSWYGIKTYANAAKPLLKHCFFWGNPQGDYLNGNSYEALFSGVAINNAIGGAVGNLSGRPLFATPRGGQWSACAYDAASGITRLSDAALTLAPGCLTGRIINVDTSQRFQALILDNTTTSVLVSGNLTGAAHVGDHWRLVDYHQADGSAALDRGLASGAPANDLEGQPRPGTDGLVDIGAYEAQAAYQPIPPATYTRVYVDPQAPGSEDGRDWANACHTIMDAILIARTYQVREVWVAGGTYREKVSVTSGTAVYGGFSGYGPDQESRLNQRDLTRHATILDGASFSASSNRDSMVTLNSVQNARVDGLTVVNAPRTAILCSGCGATNIITHCIAQANRTAAFECVASSPIIEDCVASWNRGYGFYSWPGEYYLPGMSTIGPTLRRCVASGNMQSGIINGWGAMSVSDCTLIGNRDNGARCDGSSPMVLTNCLISGSRIGFYCGRTTSTLLNCTISDNQIGVQSASSTIFNTVLAANDRGIAENYSGSNVIPTSCLFTNNPSSDFLDGNTTNTFGAAAINATIAGAKNNVDGPVRFMHDRARIIGGIWEAAGPDATGNLSYFYDAQANFTPGSLAGRLIRFRANMNQRAMIMDNTTTAVLVNVNLGALPWFTPGTIAYEIRDYDDYRLGYGSAAIDADAAAGAPATDLDGKPRPVDILGVGTSGASAFDIGCYEAQLTGPVAVILPATRRLDFGAWNITNGAAPPRQVSIVNYGFQPLVFTGVGIRLTGPNAAEFKFQSAPATTPLAPGTTRTLTLLFDPATAGARSACLEIPTNDPAAPLTTFTLTGTGVNSAPIIITHPVDQNVTAGANVAFSVLADGTAPLTYRWTRNGANLTDGGRISGAATARLTIKGATSAEAGTYACRVTNALGSATSRGARLILPFTLGVSSAHGTPTPAAGSASYTSGTQLLLSAGPGVLTDTLRTTRYTCTGWKGTGSVPASGTGTSLRVTLLQDSTITWQWKTEYYLTTAATPASLGRVTPATGWVGAGQTVTVQALPVTNYHLAAWSGSLTGTNPVASLLMNGPKTVTAHFERAPDAYGTVHVMVVPAEARWIMTDALQTTRGGIGCATLPHIPSGPVSMRFLEIKNYNPPYPPVTTQTLTTGGEVQFSYVYLWVWGNSERTYEYLLQYLLGVNNNASGLDLNKDGKVNAADLTLTVTQRPPTLPHDPQPANGATGVPVKVTLDWADSQRARSYNIYLWKSSVPGTPTSSGLTSSAYTPPRPLDYSTKYYWYIAAFNGGEESHGEYWNFTTAPNPVQVTVPNGGETWKIGALTHVAVKLDSAQAGQTVRIELWRSGRRAATLGTFSLPAGGGTALVKVPAGLEPASNYLLMAVSLKLEQEKMPMPYDTSDGLLTLAP